MSDQSNNLELSPATAWWSIATRFYSQGQWAQAADALRQALSLDPQNAALWSDLGATEQHRGDLESAAAAYHNSLTLQPGNLNTLANLAFLFVQQGQPQRALALLGPVLKTGQVPVEIWSATGHALRAVGDFANAVVAFRNATTLAPADADAWHNLAVALRATGKLTEAEKAVRQALKRNPDHAEAWSLLGSIEQSRGCVAEAITAFAHSVELKPHAGRHSNLLLAMHYADAVEPTELLAAHREWDAKYAKPLDPGRPSRRQGAGDNGPLRIGFVSSQFGLHPIGFLALPLIEHLDRTQCTVVCYSSRSIEDEYTIRFRAASDIWRLTPNYSPQRLAALIRADEIDILIDLMGHTSPQLLAFAHRPAPLQMTWLGYPGTTGMTAIDLLLADAYHVPHGDDANHSEHILRMPNGYACYGPPASAPDVTALPALQSGHLTFGCFNNPAKFSPSILQAWAEILHRVPNSRLLLKYFGLDDSDVLMQLHRRLAEAGLDSARVIFEGGGDHYEFIQSYNRVDLALDTQPYSGGLTTCEAFWMGVPVVTFPGKTFAGRHSISHLQNAGCGQFVAADQAGYVDLAVSWANRIDDLAMLRKSLRQQVATSPLCDAPRFARDFLNLLKTAWSKLNVH